MPCAERPDGADIENRRANDVAALRFLKKWRVALMQRCRLNEELGATNSVGKKDVR